MAPNSVTSTPSNPNEQLQIPPWVNEDYFQPILEKDVEDFVKIVSFTPIAATAPGENYTSVMVRVVLKIQLKDGSIADKCYILKTALDGSNTGAAFVNSMNLFPKEKEMYQNILPQYERLYKEAGVDIQLSAKCLQIEEIPERITLVMEDLKQKNFKNQDRLKGLDLPHMRAVLRKLAELHAASTVYYELNGPFSELFQVSFFDEKNRKFFEDIGVARDNIFRAAMHDWDLDNVDYYIKKMPSAEAYFNEGMRLNSVDPKEFNVLNHGDAWANNIMFQYKDNGELDQTLLVDFQVGKWGSPTQDLWYLIVSSASLDIKINEFDHFISIYHERLVECLRLLKYSKPLPSLKDIHIMMLKYGSWGPFTSGGVMTAVLFPSDHEANMDSFFKQGEEGDRFRHKLFTNPLYVKAVCQLYPFFDNKGLLDVSA